MATVKRIHPASALRVGAVVYAIFGFIVGVCLALFYMLVGSAASTSSDGGPGMRMLGFGFGLSSIIVLPIAYAIVGAIGGAIGAVIYNLAAGWVGGLEIDIQ